MWCGKSISKVNNVSLAWGNLKQFCIFGFIGVINTLIHGGVVVASVERGLLSPVPANVLAFVAANTFSFFANCRFTFCALPTWGGYGKFVSVSLTSLVMTVLLSGFAEWMGWHYLLGLALVILLVPLFSFFLQKKFTFGPMDCS